MSFHTDIARVVQQAIAARQTPGAVVLIGRGHEVLCHEAFGQRMVVPRALPMQRDTVFDLASLTKPVATATAVLHLAEHGHLLLRDPVCRYIAQFTGGGREHATIWHLLTHTAGLPAYKNYLLDWGDAVPPERRRAEVVEDICRLPLEYPVGEGFTYSCLGYILLASVVELVSGQSLDRYAAEHVFAPLGMGDTCFNPPAELRARCAATEQLPEGVLVGVVHDENARYLDGVGGNAGVFSTAEDLAKYLNALLTGAESFPLSPTTAALMMTPQTAIPGGVRSLGWDMDSAYTPQVRGDLFPAGGIGHSGYTGTSIWADPRSRGYVILLTNRVHFGREADISRLRQQVANIAAAAIGAGD